MSRPREFECPNCGAMVASGAKACRECGSDARTGWQDGEELDYQSVDIPDGWGEEGPVQGPTRARRVGFAAIVWLLVLALVAVFVLRWA